VDVLPLDRNVRERVLRCAAVTVAPVFPVRAKIRFREPPRCRRHCCLEFLRVFERKSRRTRQDHMDPTLKSFKNESESTRERLRAGTLLTAWRANPPPGVKLRSDEELDESLADMLRSHDSEEDVHVFGYGSLMWDPALEYTEVAKARLRGCIAGSACGCCWAEDLRRSRVSCWRLDRGGACTGRLYRIAATKANAELRLLWRREMLAGSYDARWVTVVANDHRLRAITFVANRHHARYVGRASCRPDRASSSHGQGYAGHQPFVLRGTVENARGTERQGRWHGAVASGLVEGVGAVVAVARRFSASASAFYGHSASRRNRSNGLQVPGASPMRCQPENAKAATNVDSATAGGGAQFPPAPGRPTAGPADVLPINPAAN